MSAPHPAAPKSELAKGRNMPATCARCGRERPASELNLEAVIHHGARAMECLDRRSCERARRRGGWVKLETRKCDLCSRPATWAHPKGGLRCGRCPRP